jgi:hypothetical protein
MTTTGIVAEQPQVYTKVQAHETKSHKAVESIVYVIEEKSV